MQITIFLSSACSSKHEILFENMEEELVTIGFVWWQLLNRPSTPLWIPQTSQWCLQLTGKEHSLIPCRECLILKPPFWKNKTWCYRNSPTFFSFSLSMCLYFPDHVVSGCLLDKDKQFLLQQSQLAAGLPERPCTIRSGWGQAGCRWCWVWSRDLLPAEKGGSLRHLEFYTLHLQQCRPGIWHTTPIPAGTQRLHTEQWNFTLKHFQYLYDHVSALLVWKKLRKQKRLSAVLLQGFMTHKPLQLSFMSIF